ncbi:major facilitator superfamily domain-containing protein [Plectosphaerella plurivora]|uniref:Major facilitator superfamily domain-containing protein n=1 Tax=Plectosphaerella plurivora TaxID=936078 RepID=A0A9P8VIQ0_9PEZI|nr:major facilitator superfamily domain-containing protein [Plectosphaerella plurivora]
MAETNEQTPLLRNAGSPRASSPASDSPDGRPRSTPPVRPGARLFSPANRILFAGFLVSLTLSLTQVPIIYVFRVMTCDVYYTNHPPFDGPESRRCSRIEIDSATATHVSILGMTTSICGVFNLFICGALIKRLGTRWSLVSQTALLGLRVACQIIAVSVGGRNGIIFMQATQIVGAFGGPRGYMLVLNTAVAEVVEKREHTGVFGRLQGAMMIGRAGGYLLGGVLGDALGIQSPFITAVGCFTFSSIYGALFMPASPATDQQLLEAKRGPSGLLAPIRILTPQRFRLANGKVVIHYGLVFLALGVFFGVFATGYAPILIQMYATSKFDFGTTENGILMSGNALILGVFLMFIFPKLIDAGRHWFATSSQASFRPDSPAPSDDSGEFPSFTDMAEPMPGLMSAVEPIKPPQLPAGPDEEDEDSTFDLFFLRWSLVVDGLITSISAWATQGWHMYLVAFLLPFAAGSAPAAKGVITEMSPAYLRQDALSAITLVESAATLTTQGLFGFIYSSLSAIDRGNLTFFCNGGLALVAVGILMLARYPPADGTRMELDDETETDDRSESSDETGVAR